MCRATKDGGRRCPAHTPASRRAQRAAKSIKRKVRERKVKDVNCTSPECVNGLVKAYSDEGTYIGVEKCDVCGGVGYLNDAGGRIRPTPAEKVVKAKRDTTLEPLTDLTDTKAQIATLRAHVENVKAPVKSARKLSREQYSKDLAAARGPKGRAKALLDHLNRTTQGGTLGDIDSEWFLAAVGQSPDEVLAARDEDRIPGTGEPYGVVRNEAARAEVLKAAGVTRKMTEMAAKGESRAVLFVKRAKQTTAAEILTAAREGNVPRVPGPCGACDDGVVREVGVDSDTPVDTMDCLECQGTGHVELTA